MTVTALALMAATDDEIEAELYRRAQAACIWRVEDIRNLMDGDSRFAGLSEPQAKAVAGAILERMSPGLQGAMAGAADDHMRMQFRHVANKVTGSQPQLDITPPEAEPAMSGALQMA